VTYHDPCDLGRASGFMRLHGKPPGHSGVELVEMADSREKCKCVEERKPRDVGSDSPPPWATGQD